MMVWSGLYPLGRPSIPSGLRMDPRLPITPGESATQTAPAIVTSTLSHASHLQRLLGNRPLGNNRSERTAHPIDRIHTQEASQASASPAGSESGRASRALMAYSALRCATAMMQAAAQKSQPKGLAGRREAMTAPMIEKLTAIIVSSSQ